MRAAISCFFFFQAEDGIRDLVRSRGLGDVYKRQYQPQFSDHRSDRSFSRQLLLYLDSEQWCMPQPDIEQCFDPVSYTHLTLPTSDLV